MLNNCSTEMPLSSHTKVWLVSPILHSVPDEFQFCFHVVGVLTYCCMCLCFCIGPTSQDESATDKKVSFCQREPVIILYCFPLHGVIVNLTLLCNQHSTQCICWVQSMDLQNPWIVLRKAWIHTLCRQSMDCALFAQSWDCAGCVYVGGCFRPREFLHVNYCSIMTKNRVSLSAEHPSTTLFSTTSWKR